MSECHRTNPNRVGLYIDFSDWIENKKAAINPNNKKDKQCFQYATAVTLNHEKIKEHPERITKIKPFISNYDLNRINYLSEKDKK